MFVIVQLLWVRRQNFKNVVFKICLGNCDRGGKGMRLYWKLFGCPENDPGNLQRKPEVLGLGGEGGHPENNTPELGIGGFLFYF